MPECQPSGCIHKSGEGVSRGGKDPQNNKCHEIPYETRAGHYMASLHWNWSQCGSIEFNRTVVCEDHFTEQ